MQPELVDMKVTFDPMGSEQKDIFAHQIARNLWCCYRRNHIISQRGIVLLAEICREIITDNITFDDESAKSFLDGFLIDMSGAELSMMQKEPEWIEKTIPFLTGKKWMKLIVELE